MTAIATPWDAYHLRANPYFQDELGGANDPGAERLRELFVGREAEAALLGRLLLADEAARSLVVGAAGVGKSSFVNRVKRDLTDGPDAPFFTHAPAIEVQSSWTALDFTAEVLKVTLRIVRGASAESLGPTGRWTATAAALRSVLRSAAGATDAWERVEQLVEGRMLRGVQLQGGVPVAQAGIGMQAAWAPPIISPASLVEVTVDAIALARLQTERRLLFHVNNLENLSPDDQAAAAQLLRDVRALFTAPGASWIFVGTTDVEQPLFRSAPQLSGFIPQAVHLAALPAADVGALLDRRYRFLQKGATLAVPPVRPEDAMALYGAYLGDLRNYLRLLSDAAVRGLDLHGGRSLTATDVIALMGPQHLRMMEQALSAANWRHFVRVVLGDSADDPILPVFRHTDVKQRCGVKDPTANRLITELERGGWIVFDRQEGVSVYYRLSGAAAIGFASLAAATGRDVARLMTVVPTALPTATPRLPTSVRRPSGGGVED
jgi:hypothetical protein